MSLYIECGYIVPGYFVGDEACRGGGGGKKKQRKPKRAIEAKTEVPAIDSQALALQAEALRIARIHADDDMILTLII